MRPPNTARREEIRKLVAGGMSQSQIADALGIEQSTVSYYVVRMGLGRGKGTRADLKKRVASHADFTTEIQRLAVEYARPIIMREIVNAAGAQLWR